MNVSEKSLQSLGASALLLISATFIALPVLALLARSLFDRSGAFVGLDNFAAYLQTPSLLDSLWRSVRLSVVSAAITTALAFTYAYALTMSAMPGKRWFKALALVPLLAPSLLMAISLVYLFGNQGLLKNLVGGSIYGEPGIVLGSVLWTFPHALLMLVVTLSTTDGRTIEAARTLGASNWRIFTSVTLPASRYGLLMAFTVVFVLVITDFGVPKVIGGQANVLATDLYKQVVGQQNFSMGAVVSVMLLLPAVGAFAAERFLRARQSAALGLKASVHLPEPHRLRDAALLIFCLAVAGALLVVIGVAVFASVATYWPYNLAPSLKNYNFDQMDGGGWVTYWNSLRLAFFTALVGSAAAFVTAWMVDKPRHAPALREALNFVVTLPLAVPGLALGLGYILFFNHPSNPLHSLYATMTILVLCTVVHFFSVAHLTMLTALRQLDREYELVAESLGVPFWKTILRVHLPVCLPALLEVAGFFFVNAMTTVSAVVFLYSPSTQLASVAVLNMDDAGDVAPAAAMAVLIFLTAALARGVFALLSAALLRRTQQWRQR
ncbi:MAG: putative 2-aminoethylphosphonate ABC transporter permease subunit [Burkholderiaceae bacterium]